MSKEARDRGRRGRPVRGSLPTAGGVYVWEFEKRNRELRFASKGN
jgi:hypothetical protein